MTYIDYKLGVLNENEHYWDDHMEMFDYENYFPREKKVNDGCWIKIRTKNGYEVHYAKQSIRKRRFNEELSLALKKLNRTISKTTNNLKSDISEIKKIGNLAFQNKTKSDTKNTEKLNYLKDKVSMLSVYLEIGLKPYEVFINRNKSKKEYYMPYQYELVDDIEDLSNACISKLTGVNIKAISNTVNEEAVFYLRSRGISEAMAILMASLKQSYFTVNTDDMITEYNKFIKNVVFVEK